jgi:2-succinyl-6-hydroxy-2,4-cyclohexadiene-1-carboxylate synthase
VFLHGFTHTGASWEPVIAALGKRYTAWAPDIRGHGGASAIEPVSLSAVIDDLRHGAPERFALVGYSMGGRIALHAAMALQERVERLVLIGASPGIADAREREERRAADEALAAEIQRSTIADFARRWGEQPVLAGQPDSVRRRVEADRRSNTPAGLAAALRALGTGALPPLWERLHELRMPVTLVVGERDEKFATIARRMAAAVRSARVIVVPDTGHAVHLEAPGAVAQLLDG